MSIKRKPKTQKGITLVALIITIVILLILVSVAISSMQDNGIFGEAQNAGDKYNQTAKNEQDTVNGYVDALNEYFVGSDTDLELMKRYVLGPQKTGRSVFEIVNLDMETAQITSFIDDPASITDASSKITIERNVYGEGNVAAALVKYNNKVYKLIVNGSYFTESVEIFNGYGEKIFEGELAATEGYGVPIPNLKEPISIGRDYIVVLRINGQEKVFYTGVAFQSGIVNSEAFNGGSIVFYIMGNMFVRAQEGVVLTAIYDVGPRSGYIEENGFVITQLKGHVEKGWCLVETPDTSYIVPEKVGGTTVDAVCIDLISGEPTFTEVVNIITLDSAGAPDSVKITVSDMDFIYDVINNCTRITNLDLTGCGDSLVFSTEVLNSINEYVDTVYVTQAVKAKYPDNAKIVAK